MLDTLAPIAAACDLTIPEADRLGVGIVGAGAIVDRAHLPAYLGAGLEIVGVHDRDADRAAEVAARHGVPVADSLQALLDDPRVGVIDIAVIADAQPAIARAALAAGKHVVCQKPLAPTLDEAHALVDAAREAGRQIAVNQQLRFDEGVAAARAMVERGWIGEPTALAVNVNIATDFGQWPWLVVTPRLEVMYHSIHYVDAIRSIFGDPERVYCAMGRRPGQKPRGETRTVTTMTFPDGRIAVIHSNHENVSDDLFAEFRIDGSEGAIRGTFGLLYDYPHGRPDTLEVHSRTLPTDGWLPYPVTTRWIPDAFAGPIGSLMRAVAGGPAPATAAADNVRTLAVCEALYRSAEAGEAVAPAYEVARA
ncbi:Gfo/Idh/MocA family protein [Patulibacter sp. S7RM1-6]